MTAAPIDRNLEFLINDVARLMTREYDRRVRDMNLTRSQWWVLVSLIRNDGSNQTELADQLDIGKVALGGLLDRLEAKGWIERRPDPDDRRAKRVFLTDAVRPLIREMQEKGRSVHRLITRGMARNDQDRLVELLMQAKGNLARED
ncbi:MAG: MarR family transcriptional regulator [Pseudomonadota bacterium]|nr:MarR family transcriptional regulator [Pseudomonadota bacterium]